MTCVSVPYLALIPEMATDYDERISLNTYRTVAAVLGTFAAVGMKELADALGGGAAGWQHSAWIMGAWIALPWLAVWAVSFERPDFVRPAQLGFVEGARLLLQHHSYRKLVGLFLYARIAVDLIGAMFLLYFSYWIGREGDFSITLSLFLTLVVLALPVWLRIAQRSDKRTVFIVGTLWWALIQLAIYFVAAELAALVAVRHHRARGDRLRGGGRDAVVDARRGDRRGRARDRRAARGRLRRLLPCSCASSAAGSPSRASASPSTCAASTARSRASSRRALALSAIRVSTSLVPAVFLLLAVVGRARLSRSTARRTRRILEAIARRAALGAGSGG